MPNPIDPIEAALAGDAAAQVAKQEGWVKANRKPLIIGAVLGLLLGALLGHIL